jgi:DNA (cytosine-5)-methyltransferase 1
MKPRLLDLFCGAGGAAVGYSRAGFEVVGVDIESQPHYPFRFAEGDALAILDMLVNGEPLDLSPGGYWLEHFDAIHASPPCQAFTPYRRTGNVGEYPDLIAVTRNALEQADLPWIIENVEGAPLRHPIMICGSMFDPPLDIRRHRLFEVGPDPWLSPPIWPCRHKLHGPDRFPGGRSVERTGHSTGKVRSTAEIGSWDIPVARQREAMGIDWMALGELSEAIPPAYTEHIGHFLMAEVKRRREDG